MTPNDFLAKIGPAATEDMRKTGVPACVTIAQAILESNWGESKLAKQANNLWFQIYQVVRENCSAEYKGATPHDDMMEKLLSARRGG